MTLFLDPHLFHDFGLPQCLVTRLRPIERKHCESDQPICFRVLHHRVEWAMSDAAVKLSNQRALLSLPQLPDPDAAITNRVSMILQP